MSIGDVVSMLRGAIFETIILSAPVLLVAMVVGLVVSIFQATTSIQEQTLTFVPKMLAIFIVLALLGGWMFSALGQYTTEIFALIPQMAK